MRIFIVDAFAQRIFEGNPAAVVLLDSWLPDALMQSMAQEHNLSETAFVTTRPCASIRWFTPTQEVPFCGHATIAAAHVLIDEEKGGNQVTFASAAGPLTVSKHSQIYTLDMPAVPHEPFHGSLPRSVRQSRVLDAFASFENLFLRLEDESAIASFKPDYHDLVGLHPFGLAITAPGRGTDFVSRYFAPGYGIPEDPVTGSIHATLGPYWSKTLGKRQLTAKQLSARGGQLTVSVEGNRVLLSAFAVTYLRGTIDLGSQ